MRVGCGLGLAPALARPDTVLGDAMRTPAGCPAAGGAPDRRSSLKASAPPSSRPGESWLRGWSRRWCAVFPIARWSSTATASPSAAGARRGAPPLKRPACRLAASTIAGAAARTLIRASVPERVAILLPSGVMGSAEFSDTTASPSALEGRGGEGTAVVRRGTREHLRRTDRASGESARCPTPVRDRDRSRP